MASAVQGAGRAPFFTLVDEVLVPDVTARGPWSAELLHGRLFGGLAAWAAECALGGDDDFTPSRLTVDLFRAAPLAPVSFDTTVVRDGGRVRLLDVALQVGGQAVARASVLLLRRGEDGATDAPSRGRWDASPPDPDRAPVAGRPFELQEVDGRGLGAMGARQLWLREDRPLVAGVELSPFVRLALAGDFASPVVNAGSQGLEHINTDFTVYVSRLPTGEWVGVEADGRVEADGIATSSCRLHDLDGPIGWTVAAAIRNPRIVLTTAGPA